VWIRWISAAAAVGMHKAWSGRISSVFFVLFLPHVICAVWVHVTVVRMMHGRSPEISTDIDDRRALQEAPA